MQDTDYVYDLEYYNEPSRKYHDVTSETWLGLDLHGWLMVLVMVVLMFLLISIMWNYCAADESIPETLTQQCSRQSIVVQEIRPGLLLMKHLEKGYPTHEETLRIVAEYDSMRAGPGAKDFSYIPPMHHTVQDHHMQPQQSCSYMGSGHADAGAFVQPPNAATEGWTVNGNQLVDLVHGDARPPPYNTINRQHSLHHQHSDTFSPE